ncbi:hypothetical protein [Saccharothrix texasensis]|nr:hypothetical protein [Saccharothrix texasensis]
MEEVGVGDVVLDDEQERRVIEMFLAKSFPALRIPHRWLDQQYIRRVVPIRKALFGYKPHVQHSAAENPLLAAPFLPGVTSLEDIEGHLIAVRRFVDALTRMKDKAGVWSYARLGAYWTAVAECRVPLDESFLVKVAQRTQLDLQLVSRTSAAWGPRRYSYVRNLVTVGDAHSNHVVVRVGDSQLELGRDWVNGSDIDPYRGSPVFKRGVVSARWTPETFSLALRSGAGGIASEQHARISIPIRLALHRGIMMYAVFLLSAFSALGMLTYLVGSWGSASDPGQATLQEILHVLRRSSATPIISAIFIPVSIAAALLLVREPSTLASTINSAMQSLIGATQVALWVFTGILFAKKYILSGSTFTIVVMGMIIVLLVVVIRFRMTRDG